MTVPPPSDRSREIVALDRLGLLSLAYYISGAIGAAVVSFLLIHFFILLGLSFVPASQWTQPAPAIATAPYVVPSPAASPGRGDFQGPPVIMFRIFAGVIGLIVVGGWTLGALTAYAGYCVKHRKHKVFIYIMAAINCIWIPYGTVLGVATILLF
jgi:hypothetical protein